MKQLRIYKKTGSLALLFIAIIFFSYPAYAEYVGNPAYPTETTGGSNQNGEQAIEMKCDISGNTGTFYVSFVYALSFPPGTLYLTEGSPTGNLVESKSVTNFPAMIIFEHTFNHTGTKTYYASYVYDSNNFMLWTGKLQVTYDSGTVNSDPANLVLDIDSLTVPSAGNSYYLTISNNGDETLYWNTQNAPDWVNLYQSNGSVSGGDDLSLQISIDQNTDTVTRTCNIKFSNNYNASDYEYLRINQEGTQIVSRPADLQLQNTNLSASSEGGNYSLKILNNGEDTLLWNAQNVPVEVTLSQPNGSITGNNNSEIKVYIPQNASSESKVYSIKFVNSNDSSDYDYLEINQEGQIVGTPKIEINHTEFNLKQSNNTQIDVLVAYTPKAKDTVNDINSLVEKSIELTNETYKNNNIPLELNLVHIYEENYTELNYIGKILWRLKTLGDGYMEGVHKYRDKYAADIVVLIQDNQTDSPGGKATYYSEDSEGRGFCTVRAECEKIYKYFSTSAQEWKYKYDYVLAHEIGHLLNARHDYGYENFQDGWQTIMTQPDPACPTRIPYWSSPNVFFEGKPVGTSLQNNDSVIRKTAENVANYRNANVFNIKNSGYGLLRINSILSDNNWLSMTGPVSPFDIEQGKDQDIAVKINWNLIKGVSKTGTIIVNSNDPEAPIQTVRITAKPSAVILTNSGTIYQGQTISQPVSLSENYVGLTKYQVNWPGSDLDLVIKTPSGQILDTSDERVVAFYEGETEDYYIIDSNETGDWNVDILGIDVDPDGEPYEFKVSKLWESGSLSNSPIVHAGNDKTIYKDETFNLSGTFTDPDYDEIHTARISWGDGTIEHKTLNYGILEGYHNYSEGGIYTVIVNVTDNKGGTGSNTMRVTVIPDRDRDGVIDSEDAFPDDPDEWEDTDSDGIGNNADTDDDNDEMPDDYENANGFDPLDAADAENDADNDGYTNVEEYLGESDPFDPTSIPETVYEDAEDGLTEQWEVSNKKSSRKILNVFDEERQSRVIEFSDPGMKEGYRLFNEDGELWHNTEEFIIDWSMKYAGNFMIVVDIETTEGQRFLRYRPLNKDGLGKNQYVDFGLGKDITDNQWHTFVRDLQADLKQAQPDNDILEVNGVIIRGSGRVDDIKLMRSIPITLEADESLFTNLNCLDNDKEGSVKNNTNAIVFALLDNIVGQLNY
ncbi:Peptidase M12 domain-containing protein, immunoglobulin-like fold-containing [Desulfonema limicola]|uniref:Peptidase M12 domain-containing protein, immunoglobulin-like fold-containing n=1 Tax=Desulfonema limicola TaxID=45656 RepID=A0A975GF36_9BACT|nr:M12 family metallo-peptidase [Desulfonema limicola]QTA78780.1 Peptidase M12 domain-containing protein, immunoglobulin-like fold-containing [Desulfonema limicola]